MESRDFPKEQQLGAKTTRFGVALYLRKHAARRAERLGNQIGRVQTEPDARWLYQKEWSSQPTRWDPDSGQAGYPKGGTLRASGIWAGADCGVGWRCSSECEGYIVYVKTQ